MLLRISRKEYVSLSSISVSSVISKPKVLITNANLSSPGKLVLLYLLPLLKMAKLSKNLFNYSLIFTEMPSGGQESKKTGP